MGYFNLGTPSGNAPVADICGLLCRKRVSIDRSGESYFVEFTLQKSDERFIQPSEKDTVFVILVGSVA